MVILQRQKYALQVRKRSGIKVVPGRPCEHKDGAWEEFKMERPPPPFPRPGHQDRTISSLKTDLQGPQPPSPLPSVPPPAQRPRPDPPTREQQQLPCIPASNTHSGWGRDPPRPRAGGCSSGSGNARLLDRLPSQLQAKPEESPGNPSLMPPPPGRAGRFLSFRVVSRDRFSGVADVIRLPRQQ